MPDQSCFTDELAAVVAHHQAMLAELPVITQRLLRSEVEVLRSTLEDLPLACDGSEAVRVLRDALERILSEVAVLSDAVAGEV